MNLHVCKSLEEHYTLVFQPNNIFYHHVTPISGKATAIGQCILDKLKTDRIDLEKLLFIGSDGTNTNTGNENGNF